MHACKYGDVERGLTEGLLLYCCCAVPPTMTAGAPGAHQQTGPGAQQHRVDPAGADGWAGEQGPCGAHRGNKQA